MAEKVNPDDVKALREKSGKTQAECAKALFSDLRSWQRWESGEREMHRAFFEYAKITLKCTTPSPL